MEGFLKTNGLTQAAPHLSGIQKVALFLGEIGQIAGDAVLQRLNLTTSQIAAIRKEMEKLGYYNPHNQFHVMREYSVLTEAANFGIMHNIYREVPHKTPEEIKKQERIEKLQNESPENIANFLRLLMESK